MDQYRVFGNPIQHSRSPFIHKMFADQTEQDICYTSQLIELGDFAKDVKSFIEDGGKGANVTVPFKEDALAICDELSDRAKLAGAVNTLSFNNGKICGDNTDGIGLVSDLLNNDIVLKDQKILLLGAGGAAKGVILPLLEQNPSEIIIANRTLSKAQDLEVQFNNKTITASSYADLSQEFDLIINATSASLSGFVPDIPSICIGKNTVCYDMVYGKEPTAFILWASKNGANKVIDGLGMLVMQAAESFNIWRGVEPKSIKVLKSIRKKLQQE